MIENGNGPDARKLLVLYLLVLSRFPKTKNYCHRKLGNSTHCSGMSGKTIAARQ